MDYLLSLGILAISILYFVIGFVLARLVYHDFGRRRLVSPMPPPPPPIVRKDLPVFDDPALVVPRPPVAIKVDQTVSGRSPVGSGGASFESL